MKSIAIQTTRCIPEGRLSVSGLLFAGAMAEALLAPLARDGSLDARVAVDPARPALRAHDEAEVMSLCTVRAAPVQVGALLTTEVASDREAAAARALFPRLSACLGKGVRLVTNRPALRASLALAAWRLVLNNGGA